LGFSFFLEGTKQNKAVAEKQPLRLRDYDPDLLSLQTEIKRDERNHPGFRKQEESYPEPS
jgi:hypothetical protein